MSLKVEKYRTKLKVNYINPQLLYYYNNYHGNRLKDYITDFQSVIQLRRYLRKRIKDGHVIFQNMKNSFMVLKNVFSIEGFCIILIDYFSEDDLLFEYFSTIVYFYLGVKISNRMNKKFLEYLTKQEKI